MGDYAGGLPFSGARKHRNKSKISNIAAASGDYPHTVEYSPPELHCPKYRNLTGSIHSPVFDVWSSGVMLARSVVKNPMVQGISDSEGWFPSKGCDGQPDPVLTEANIEDADLLDLLTTGMLVP